MKVEFDPEPLGVMMDMWKQTIDLSMPMKDEFKIHMMQNRRQILMNYERASGNWLLVIGCLTPTEETKAEFAEATGKIKAFHEWAKAALAELDVL